jgi:hypothetical protein
LFKAEYSKFTASFQNGTQIAPFWRGRHVERLPSGVSLRSCQVEGRTRRNLATRQFYCHSVGTVSPGDPIAFPQRCGLVGATKRFERVGGDAGAVFGPGVVGAESFVVYANRSFGDSDRFHWLICLNQQTRKSTVCGACDWMIDPAGLGVN